MATNLGFGLIADGDAALQAYQDLTTAQGVETLMAMAPSAVTRRELEALVSIPVAETVEQVCTAPKIEALFIALRSGPREEAMHCALQAGKHVLVAGPWDAPLGQAQELCALAEQRGLALGVSAPWAVDGAHLAARSLVRAGLLGEVVAWRDDLLRPQPMDDTLRQALRPLALFGWLSGLEAREVYALHAPSGEGLDLVAMLVRYTNDCLGSVVAGRGIPGGPGMHPQGMRVLGTIGQLDLTDEPMIYRTRSSEDAPAHSWRQVRHAGPRGDRTQAVAQFAAAVRAGEEPPLPGRVAMRALRILDAAQRSIAAGTPAMVG